MHKFTSQPTMTPAQILKCLSDDTRLSRTLPIQQEGEVCVCELMEALEQSQPKISRHLAQLRNCGLLVDRRQQQWVFYSLHPNLPEWVHNTLREIGAIKNPVIFAQHKKLRTMTCRPARC